MLLVREVIDWAPLTHSRYVPRQWHIAWGEGKDSNLVDSASSHTLVSKIKPCMSKYKSFTLKLRCISDFCLTVEFETEIGESRIIIHL